MQAFDIKMTCEPSNSYRVARIMADFDVKKEHCDLELKGQINLPQKWNIGVICGASGTGKTTIARQLFKDVLFSNFIYSGKSVIDDMPTNCTVDEIEKMFYAVGFGSVPEWLKPYNVLSNGEKMRVDLANALLRNDIVAFDEFTSVVDRNVAQTCCIAVNKAVKKYDKKFIAISCHYDILDYLDPDWVFDTNEMKCFFGIRHVQEKDSISRNVGVANGKSLNVITI